MFRWLDGLAISYLHRRKVSVFMNFKVDGGFVQNKGNRVFLDRLATNNTVFLDKQGYKVDITEK